MISRWIRVRDTSPVVGLNEYKRTVGLHLRSGPPGMFLKPASRVLGIRPPLTPQRY